jgi:Zn-dependent peptidase ImmA (M78 family)/transcriptional regulator with XRE-family HTH domain
VESESPAQPGLPLSSRVRTARDLRGLTQAETVERMPHGISTAALSQIEAGGVRPTQRTLEALASALEVPVDFFFVQWPGGIGDAELRMPYFRDLRATPARERRRARALALLLNDLLAVIEHHVQLPPLDVPGHSVGPDAGLDEVEDAAEMLRREWALGDAPVPHVVREIERHGVPVARLSIGHRLVDGFSVILEPRPLILLTEDKSSYVRSRFDAAHEVGHVVMHADRTDVDRSAEKQAHAFSSYFLLPRLAALEELPDRIDSGGWTRLAQMKQRWGMSMGALLRRARDLRRIREDEYRNAMKYMSARGWRAQEPGDRELGPPEAPLLLQRSLRTIEVETGQTVEELVDAAHLPLADTLELVRASNDKRPVIEL